MSLWQATLQVGRPGQSKTDDELTEHIIEQFRMAKTAARAVKHLWGNSLDKLAQNARKARDFHKRHTFEAIGVRVVVPDERELWLDSMGRFAAADRQLATEWLDNYDLVLEQERLDKNSAFRIEDYPTRAALADRLYFRYDLLPMPEPNQFVRDALTDDLGRRLAADYEARLQSTTAQISRQVLNTLLGLISDTAESLASDGPIVDSEGRKGPFAKLHEYLDRIPALNITGDPTIARIAADARERLAYTSEELRKSQHTRQLAAARASNIALAFGATQRKIDKAA